MRKGNKGDKNFLDYIPIRIAGYRWEADEEGLVTIYVENRGFFNRAAQKLFHRPKISQVHLEKTGSFIWPLIDGKKTIYEIGEIVVGHFHDELNPLYPRLSKYFGILKNCGFVELK